MHLSEISFITGSFYYLNKALRANNHRGEKFSSSHIEQFSYNEKCPELHYSSIPWLWQAGFFSHSNYEHSF